MRSIADLRTEYAKAALDEQASEADPLRQFSRWWDEATGGEVAEANAMSLATVGANGQPSLRTVLLKGYDEAGFVFFTNYESRKGSELAGNPAASLLFFWRELERQVRIDGSAEKISAEESDQYYRSRPLASRIGAWASPQSRTIPNRAWLVKSAAEMGLRHGLDPERPDYWGGFRVKPVAIEFWQGRRSRLHDRLFYTRIEGGWQRQRLAP